MLVGLIFIFAGLLFLVISAVSMVIQGKNKGNIEVAVGGFIGPIPFGFFTSKRVFWVWLAIVIIGMVLWLLARRI